jgi:hypothetical protein
MRIKPILVAVGSLAAFATAVPAEARINQRQNHQQQRIGAGVTNGSLTAGEATRLEARQVHINRYEARSRADGGGLSYRERYRLERMQDKASHRIYAQKHDAQGR